MKEPWSECRQHAGEDLQAEVVLVAETVGPPLDHTDFVVEPFDEAEGDLVFVSAVGGDSGPVPVDHLGEVLVGLEALPFEGGSPVLEEASGPPFPPIVPELSERLLEQVGGVQALVRREEGLEGLASVLGEVLPVGEKRVLLALDKAPLLTGRRAYSLFLTLSKASPRWRRMWNLSNKIAACGAFLVVELRNGFHMSITAKRTFLAGDLPRNW